MSRKIPTPDSADAGRRASAGHRDNAPAGYGTVTPWVISRDTARLIDFAKEAFGAQELARAWRQRERLLPLALARSARRAGTDWC
jgi:hypothetical protein